MLAQGDEEQGGGAAKEQDTTDIERKQTLVCDLVCRQGSPRIHDDTVDVGCERDGGDRRRTSRIWRERGVGAVEHGPDQSRVYAPEARGRGRTRTIEEECDIRRLAVAVAGPVLRRAAQRDPYPGQSCWRWLIVDGWDGRENKRTGRGDVMERMDG